MTPFPRVDPAAPCLTGDPERFFDPARAEGAKAECRCCPSRQVCLLYALEWDVEGVWGGLDEKQRKTLRDQLGIVPRPLSFGKGTSPWGPQPHGTAARYRWDIRNGHRPCGICRDAENRRNSPHNPSPWRGRTTA